MTPRRSSRARTTQPSPALLQHSSSSSSGNSLTRGERATRSNNKIPSPQRSTTYRSQSLDEPDSKNDAPHTRQRQRARDEDNDDPHQTAEGEDEEEEEEAEEEEITRCLCGQQDYPGLPPSRRDALGRLGHKSGGKDESGGASTDASDPLSDDLGSMFIQCDSCKVWQHGGCVGIMDEAMSPDEYFCEECRKDLHKITTESNGQNSSQYLPVAGISSPGSSSRASSRDNSRRSRDSKTRQNETTNNPKRRSTMNSRDAAYDEEEQLRRAIEESKEESRMSHDDAGSRRPKRSRSDSEANKQTVKRQRTSSPSPSSHSKQSNPVSQPDSDDESKAKANGGAKKQQRASSTRNQRDKDTKETEEAEPERPDTANRRKSRSERRRGDESEHEGGASPTKAAASNDPEPTDQTPGTPVQAQEPPAPRPSTRKSGRPPARRGGRQGRNQYTRDQVNGEGNHSPNSPLRDQGTGRDSPNGNGNGNGGSNGVHVNGSDSGSKPSKARHLNPHRTSMNEMKRRVAAILEFISRMQVEMAVSGESTTPPNGNGNGNQAPAVKGADEQLAATSEGGAGGAVSRDVSVTDGEGAPSTAEKEFKDLSSVEMMDVLTRHLLKWQQEYGKYGEK